MRAEKQLLLDEIKQKIDSSKAMIIARYDRLPPNLSWDFRDRLSKSGALFEVVRKRVFLKAAEMAGFKIDESQLSGNIGVVFIQQTDAMPSAKVLIKFSEDNHNILQVITGQIEGKTYVAADIEALAKLPGINEMRSEFIGLLISPMALTLSVLDAVMAEPVSILEQKVNK